MGRVWFFRLIDQPQCGRQWNKESVQTAGERNLADKDPGESRFCFTAMIDIYPSPQATVNETPPSAASVPLSSFPSVAESHNTPPQKQVNIRAIAAICGAFIPLLFVAALYPVEPPDQPRENLISLGKKDRCTLYSLDADKHIDDELEKRMVNQALEESGVGLYSQ